MLHLRVSYIGILDLFYNRGASNDKSKANKTIHCIHNNNITLCFYNLQVQGYDCQNGVYPSVIEIVLCSTAGAREIKMNSDFLENLVCPCYKIYKAEGVNLLGYSIFYLKKGKNKRYLYGYVI